MKPGNKIVLIVLFLNVFMQLARTEDPLVASDAPTESHNSFGSPIPLNECGHTSTFKTSTDALIYWPNNILGALSYCITFNEAVQNCEPGNYGALKFHLSISFPHETVHFDANESLTLIQSQCFVVEAIDLAGKLGNKDLTEAKIETTVAVTGVKGGGTFSVSEKSKSYTVEKPVTTLLALDPYYELNNVICAFPDCHVTIPEFGEFEFTKTLCTMEGGKTTSCEDQTGIANPKVTENKYLIFSINCYKVYCPAVVNVETKESWSKLDTISATYGKARNWMAGRREKKWRRQPTFLRHQVGTEIPWRSTYPPLHMGTEIPWQGTEGTEIPWQGTEGTEIPWQGTEGTEIPWQGTEGTEIPWQGTEGTEIPWQGTEGTEIPWQGTEGTEILWQSKYLRGRPAQSTERPWQSTSLPLHMGKELALRGARGQSKNLRGRPAQSTKRPRQSTSLPLHMGKELALGGKPGQSKNLRGRPEQLEADL